MPANTARNAILKAKIEGVITEIMVKTGAANVYVDDTTTLSAKLAEIIADLGKKAVKTDVDTALAGKADSKHSHAQTEVTGLEAALTERPTKTAMDTAISTAISGLIDGAPATYDTLKEIATYINSNQSAMDALNSAIGNKLDKSVFETFKGTVAKLGALAGKDKVAEADVEATLMAKINASADGNHSHTNKTVLDGIDAGKVSAWDGAVAKQHEHTNKAVLDGVTSAKVSAWDAKSRVLFSNVEPQDLTEKDLWVHLQ